MGKPTGFLELTRETPGRRPVQLRVQDWLEVYQPFPAESLRGQAGRCMDCGIPFCHQGCPLGNLIPDWNDLIYRDRWQEAAARLHATNNFPEFTGRLCPAPCEASCVLGINDLPVTIKQVEVAIVDRAFDEGWVKPEPAKIRTGRRVAVVGSGPAGLAAAQQLARQGHGVVLYERADRIGGLLRYGIPDFKMHKRLLDRRLEQMTAEGVELRPGVDVGGGVSGEALRAEFDAVCLAVGATEARPLTVPGADLRGVHYAMPYLERQNRLIAGDTLEDRGSRIVDRGSSGDAALNPVLDSALDAGGKRVIILGGGDTGADCLGTAHRQGAARVRQFEIAARPPDSRSPADPWPQWPTIYRVSAAHEEGGEREYAVMTTHLEGEDGVLKRLHGVHVEVVITDGRQSFVPIPGTEFEEEVDLLLLAMGFSGPEPSPLFAQLGVTCDASGRIQADPITRQTVQPDVFVAGDARRGASLIVWAIAEGRQAAQHIGKYLASQT